MDDVFLTTEEVLEYLQVNLRTVYRLIKAGKIPAVRVGRQWRFRKADIDLWLEGQQTTAAGRVGGTGRSGAGPSGGSAAPAPQSENGLPRRPRVLVVDDEASIRDLLSKTLALAEYDVETSPDGRVALTRLRSQAYDLLISDLKMPGMDGLTLIREARRLFPSLPVVIITAYSTEASAIDAINLGVQGYLTKPFRIAKILATAAKALGE
jgi:excisionase family DNA binding protein